MKGAAIDIGTNSMRLLLFEYEQSRFSFRKKHIISTQIGKDIDSDGFISEAGISKNIEALRKFKCMALEFGAEKIKCIATQALRISKNGDLFVSSAKKELDIDVEIISGEKEANLGYTGVLNGMDSDYTSNIIVVDIGGGSTEIIFGDGFKIDYKTSISIGALLLTRKFFDKGESDIKIEQMKNYIRENISDFIINSSKAVNNTLVGIGGSITTVAAISYDMDVYDSDRIHRTVISKSTVYSQIDMIKSMKPEERKNIKGLMPKRSDIILAGEIILSTIMELFNKDKIVVSEYDNLEGMVLGGYFNE